MTRRRLSSLLLLLLAGYALVILPLLAVLVTAYRAVEGMTEQSVQSIRAQVAETHASLRLVEDTADLERSARQYLLVNDPDFLALLRQRHEGFLKALGSFRAEDLNAEQMRMLDRLRDVENNLFVTLNEPIDTLRGRQDILLPWLSELTSLARNVLLESNKQVNIAAESLQVQAAAERHRLTIIASTVIPVVALVAALFTWLISRPIRQIDRAIHRLGDGDFTTPLQVSGPADIQALAVRLDWLRRRLMELEEQKINFLRHVSHDLKTPLTAIREGSQLLQEEVIGPLNEEQVEIARIVCQNSLQLQKQIEDLLNFSVTQAPAPFIEHRPVQLDRVLRRAVEDNWLAARGKSIQLGSRLVEATIIGDAEKLRVIFDNLLSNAIKYAPEGGQVAVALGRENGEAVIDVTDDGPGIPPEELERIFAPFYQAQNTHSGPVKGTGIGLSIAQEYTRAHEGQIKAIDVEHGAHFQVRLPLAGSR